MNSAGFKLHRVLFFFNHCFKTCSIESPLPTTLWHLQQMPLFWSFQLIKDISQSYTLPFSSNLNVHLSRSRDNAEAWMWARRGGISSWPRPVPQPLPPTSSESFAVLRLGGSILKGRRNIFLNTYWVPLWVLPSPRATNQMLHLLRDTWWLRKTLWQAHHWEATSHGKISFCRPFPISLNSCPYIIHPTNFYCWGLSS